MIIFIDIDKTICVSPDNDYNKSQPIWENINKANKLYDEGHQIIYWTSRGICSNMDWTELTKEQFCLWGIKYHELRFDKPFYDVFIDDKALNTEDWK